MGSETSPRVSIGLASLTSRTSLASLTLAALLGLGCGSGRADAIVEAPPGTDASTAPEADASVQDGAAEPPQDASQAVEAGPDAAPPFDPSAVSAGGDTCGWHGQGRKLSVATDVELCVPKVVCNAETCPPALADCVNGACVYKNGYQGLATFPEAWATYYCDLPGGGCHGVTQLQFPEITAANVAKNLGLPTCYAAGSLAGPDAKCVGIVASPPMMVGNSQEAKNPDGSTVSAWGLGMTEASGLCYEIAGPGGAAVVAITDRCGGYCKCKGSGYQECGPCVNAPDMQPNCACVGTEPGLSGECCGRGCSAGVKADCDWCASNNHPHFDLDTATFNRVCGAHAGDGSCRLTRARFVPCMTPDPAWPPGGGGGAGASCPPQSFACPAGAPTPSQPQIPGTGCCCNWGLAPGADGKCH
jgi:hypothetical protein